MNRSAASVVQMQETPNPETAFTFEFDDSGAVSSLKLADNWSQIVEVEQFGFALMLAYAEQHATAVTAVAPEFTPGRPAAGRFPRELRDEVVELSKDVSSLFEALSNWTPMPPEPAEVGDRYRHVTIEVVAGLPNQITVNEQWLRTADYAEIEGDVVAAFRAMAEVSPADDMQGRLGGLQQRLGGLMKRHNDHVSG